MLGKRKDEDFDDMSYWTWGVTAEFLAPIREVQFSILIPQAGNLNKIFRILTSSIFLALIVGVYAMA